MNALIITILVLVGIYLAAGIAVCWRAHLSSKDNDNIFCEILSFSVFLPVTILVAVFGLIVAAIKVECDNHKSDK